MLTRRVVEHSKDVARLAPVRPAVKAGLRASLATILPAVVSSLLHISGGIWMCVGGFNTSFADKGGSYRSRALSMGAAALACSLSATVAGLVSNHPALAVPAALLWVTACSYAGVYGAAATTVGNTAATTFVISLALPATGLLGCLERGAFLVGGALWAMLLSLVLWPIRPYRPARLALSRCFHGVADLAGEVGMLSTRPEDADSWQTLIQRQHGRIRATLEETRLTLEATRRGRHGESPRGERLLVLLQIADAVFSVLVALGDVTESLVREAGASPAQQEVERALSAASQALHELADVVETEGRVQQRPALDWGAERLRTLPARSPLRAQHAARLLAQLREFTGIAVDTASSLHDDSQPRNELVPPQGPAAAQRPSLLAPLRDNFSRSSVVLRHALRVGLTTAVAVWVSTALGSNHGYWITITVLTIMQPYTGSTFLKALQRVVGTVVGGVLAAAVAAELHHPYAIMGLLFFTAAASVAVIAVNYGLFTIFVTLTFVLLAEVGTGDWGLARVRVLNTLIGGALALAGSWLLWERSEKELFPEQLAQALRADSEFLRQVVSACVSGRKFLDPQLSEARRKLGLATLNAEASFQRLLAEPRRRNEPLEPPMTLLVYTRRFAAAVTALLAAQPEQVAPPTLSLLERFASAAGQVLDDVADAVAHSHPPAPLPDLETLFQPEPSLLQAQLKSVTRQLTVLHEAAVRRSPPAQAGEPAPPGSVRETASE